jgi:hypothetical protein
MSLGVDYSAVGSASKRVKWRIGDGEGNPFGAGPLKIALLGNSLVVIASTSDHVITFRNFGKGCEKERARWGEEEKL